HIAEYLNRELPDSPSWTAPESWAVDKDDDATEEPVYSSSEDSHSGFVLSTVTHKRRSRRKTTTTPKPIKTNHSADEKPYAIRIYKADHTYHVVSIPSSVTVGELTPLMNQKLLSFSDRELHKLHLKERGRGEHYLTLLCVCDDFLFTLT